MCIAHYHLEDTKAHEHLSPNQQTSFDVRFDVPRTLICKYKSKAYGVDYVSSSILPPITSNCHFRSGLNDYFHELKMIQVF